MSPFRFKAFQTVVFKTVTFMVLSMSAFLLAGTSQAADVSLAWDGVSQAGVTVEGYRVFYGTQSGTYPDQGCKTTNTSCTVSGLIEGQTYHFAAVAYNSYGQSAYSDPVSYTVPEVLQTFTITASSGNDGSISPSGPIGVTEGLDKTFSIRPNSGFHIDTVLVDGGKVGTPSSYTFQNLSDSHTIYATFAPNVIPTHRIDAATDGNGSISPVGQLTLEEGRDQRFVITANPGYDIANVQVDGKSLGPLAVYEFLNINNAHTISASFRLKTYKITAKAGGNGSITPGTVTVPHGSGQYFTITADQGYEVADVVVDGQSVGAVTTRGFDGITGNHTITASFKAVSADSPPNGGSDADAPDSGTAGNSSGSSDTSSPNGATTDTGGGVSPAVTPKQEFINQAPDKPGLLLPSDGALDVSLTPLLEIAGFEDADADDDHGATRWQVAMDEGFEQLVLDVISRSNNYLVNFSVPDGALCAEQNYYWRAQVKDAQDWSDWSKPFAFATARGREDVNGNGVPDEQEPGYSDLDSDGQNDNDQPLMRVFRSSKGQSHLGINAVAGVSRINCFTGIDPASISVERRFKLKYGLMVFNVTVDHPGATAKFELYLPEKPHPAAKWYKYDAINGWYEYPVTIVGDKYIVEITDGELGDADGVANGIIVDPIGLAEISNGMESVDTLDAAGPGDTESTIDSAKNACFIQACLDPSATGMSAAGIRLLPSLRWIASALLIAGLAIAWFQAGAGWPRHRRRVDPNVAKVGGLEGQGVKGEAVNSYRKLWD
ncbi:MAG: choice-of-anchor U domain-containing protein [Desulfobacterales bacterium]